MPRVLLVLAVLLATACQIERRSALTGPNERVVQVWILPDTVMLDPLGSLQFQVYGRTAPGDSVPVDVRWTASAGTITQSALFTADSSEADVTVTATLNDTTPEAAPLSANAVVRKKKVVELIITPEAAVLVPGATQPFATLGARNSGDTVAVSANYTATGGTVSSSGMYTAGAAPGDFVVVARRGSLADTAVVTILDVSVPVASVVVTPATADLRVGTTAQLSATTLDSAGYFLPGRTVTWSSDAPGIASVSANGLVTAVAVGSATITATSEGKSGSAAVSVSVVPVASVTVTPGSAGVRVGGTVQLNATAKDSASNVLNGRPVTWSSNAPGVATVSASGLVSGVAAGSATITATSEGKSGTSAITVTVAPVASVTVSPATASLTIPGTVQLSAVTKDSAGNTLTGRTVSWTSAATGVATVSASGVVTAVSAGSATITASSEGKSGTAAITVLGSPGTRVGWYASPSGTGSGDGSASRPWNLQTALNGGNGKVQPGDTIWLRGGTYSGTFTSSLTGTASAPIIVRQYPGERATIDGGTTQNSLLTVDGSYAFYWGFEIMSSGTQRYGLAGTGTPLRGTGIYVRNASNVKFINLILHDVGHGTYTENDAHNIELYGWIVYNGGNEDGNRSDGHGIYIKGDGIGWKVARDNVIFNQFGFGIHGYAQSGTTLKGLVFDGNVLFNNGTPSSFDNPNLQLGGTTIADNDSVINNMAYFSPGVSSGNGNVRIGYSSTLNGTAIFRNNYVVGGTRTLEVGYWTSLAVQGNTIVGPAMVLIQRDPSAATRQQWSGDMHYRDPNAQAWQFAGTNYTFANWQARSGAADQASGTTPSTPQVFVRPNRYEPGRATIVIYNWSLQASVPVDLSGVVAVGNRYEVRNVQDIFGAAIASGTYAGGTISVPMAGVTPPQPIGGAFQPLIKTGPNFDVFVVTSAP